MALAALFLAGPASAVEHAVVESFSEPPVKAEQLADDHWFFDFGLATFGTIEIAAPGVAPGTSITVHMGEALSAPATVHRNPSGTVRYQSHQVLLTRESPASPNLTWAPPGWMKDGWLTLPKGMPEVMPFRYLEIEGAPAGFSASQVRRISWAVPFDDHAAAFQSSSPALDAVWNFCKHSIKATTFMGLYVDGDRERKPYEADVLINQLSYYCQEPRYDIARLSHEYLLEKPTWPTEWRLQSVILAWNDFLWSGDDVSLRGHYATLKDRAMIGRRTSEGFFEGWNKGEIRDIVDWPAGERDGYDMTPAVKTAVTAFHFHSLILLEKIALQLGKSGDASEFAALA